MLHYFYGVGLGNIRIFNPQSDIGLESDIFLYSIQFSMIGLIIYIYLFIYLFNFYVKINKIKNDHIINSALLMLITYFIGSFLIPLSLQRIISNIFFITQGLFFLYGQQLSATRKSH